MPKPIIRAPYYDDYNPEKDYTTILAVPGRAEQAREFTQIQTTLYDHLGRIGDTILKNGSIVSGCSIVIRDKEVIISSGRIYYNGLVRMIGGTTVAIDAVGSEIIGVKLTEEVITELEDPSLRDPAQGYENYGQQGSHRLKESLKFLRNDDTATTVFRLEEGELVKSEVAPELDVITDVLARRTYDESGNYKVTGLDLRDRKEVRNGKLLLSLTDGKAYISGFEVIKPTAFTIPISYSQDVRQVLNEPKGYTTGTLRYLLNNQPVKEITQVKSTVEVVETVTRGNITGGIDYLAKTPVVDIISVEQGSTTFKKGVDFQLVNDGIDWSLPGLDPAVGTTYKVTYRYNKSMVSGVDFDLELFENRHHIKFLGKDLPVNGTPIDVTYNFYLARRDLIILNKDGDIMVKEGKPDILRLVETPLNQNEDTLTTGSVLVYPNSTEMEIMNFNTTRLSQRDLYNMSRRLNDMEYNQAISDLDREAMEGEAPTDLKGIFTDGFIGLSKADIAHPEYNCTIDIDRSELTLPTEISVNEVTPNMGSFETQVGIIGDVIMAPFTHHKVLSQPHATESMLVNPYAVFNPMSLISLHPNVDNWVDSERMEVKKQRTVTTSLRRWWYHRGAPWAEEEKQKWMDLGLSDGGESLGWNNAASDTSVSSSDVVFDEAILYMRQNTVKITAQNFTPGVDNIECFFNDTLVPLTPVEGHTPGTKAGTVKADSSGKFRAEFKVPPNTPCGSVEVKLTSPLGSGTAVYQAQGRKQVIQDTVLTTTVRVRAVDPLAQSFSFEQDTTLTKADLFFATKDEDKAVIVEVRNMVNGYPGNICYSTVVVDAKDVKVSAKGTEATTVEFEQPVYCKADEQRCITILSDSNLYSMHIATLGGKDILTENYVTSQPYTTGVLFSSSNALTWSAHQTQDLKFNLYSARFAGDGIIMFNEVTDIIMNRLLLAAQVVDYKNAGVEWYFKIDKGAWLPLEAYVDRELSATANKVSLKAVLKVTQNMSPIMAKDIVNLIGFMEKTKGTYVSRNITMDEEFTKIKVIMDLAVPSGTSCKVYYQNQDVSMNWVELTNPTRTPITTEFTRHEWSKETGINAKNYRVKVVMETSNPMVRPRAKKLMSILKY